MKHIIIIAALFAATFASAQTKAVLKNINGGTITESLTIGSGKTLTIASGATINATGATITGFTASAAFADITGAAADNASLSTALGLKATLADPTFTGAVSLGSSAQSSSSFTVINNGSTSASLVLKSGDGSYNSKIRPVSTLTGLRTVTLPDASGTVLFTDGSGASLTGITPSQLAQASATSGQVLTWSGSAWAPATATGGVTSVTGTANQITVTGSTTPTLSLPATITGLTSVTSTTFVGALTGVASLNLLKTGGALTGALTNSVNGAASTPAVALTGSMFSGGTATTTKPMLLIEPAGTTSTGWSTSGTALGINVASAFSGNSLDVVKNGSSVAYIRHDGWIVSTFGIGTSNIYTTGGGVCASTGTFAGANALNMTAASVAGPFGLTGAQSLSGAGAVNVTSSVTKFTSTGGAQALTLANGTDGQIKLIIHVVDGGSGVLTPTTKTGFTSLTFTNAGDSATLIYSTTIGWTILAINGATITP